MQLLSVESVPRAQWESDTYKDVREGVLSALNGLGNQGVVAVDVVELPKQRVKRDEL